LAKTRVGPAVGLLDVGTSKTVCLIVAPAGASGAPPAPERSPGVLGIGITPTLGIKAGVVVDLDAVEQTVRGAAAQAEHSCGMVLERVVVAVACGAPRSTSLAVEARVAAGLVGDADLARVTAAARSYTVRAGRTVLDVSSLAYALDGVEGISDPRGLAGRRLGALVSVVSAEAGPVENLLKALQRAYLGAAVLVPAPLASALAATSAHERAMGVLSVDLGAGTTGLALFAEGRLVASEVIPVGGDQLTGELADWLGCPVAEAERIKRECGTLARRAADEEDRVAYAPERGAQATSSVSKGQLRAFLELRVADQWRAILSWAAPHGLPAPGAGGVVVTGGASQLDGMCDFAAAVLGRPVRQGRLLRPPGMPSEGLGPAFATALGLARVMFDAQPGTRRVGRRGRTPGYVGRVREWLQESF
jgi:cell division protein FtsA